MKGKAADPEKERARREKISAARRLRLATTGFLNSPEARAKQSASMSGRKHSAETKRRMSAAKKGKTPKNFVAAQAKAHAAPKPKGDAHPNWKGDAVGYYALHEWVRNTLGAPSQCARCGTSEAKRYEWANVSKEYKRDTADWIRLCVSCHRKEGYENGEYEAWNKGRKVQTNTGRTHVKKGQRIAPATEFQPGLVPHNKYLEPKPCAQCGKPFQPKEDTRRFCGRQCYWASMRK